MARISLHNVTKTFSGRVTAVRDFNLDVNDGEFVVLVGPSGCGKSTTLRMIAGLEEVTSGTISIGDRVVNNVHPKDRDIAMVFQNYALYPHMTVYKNMSFALRLRKEPKPEIDRKVREAAAILGIEDLLERKPKALSGGQRQRVALGRAIVRQPRAFLFDEPLSNLDAKLRIGMRGELKRLHMRLKTTTVYVTHDQEEAMTLGDRVVVMNDASIQQVGAPLEVYAHPCNRFVAGFVGMPPMNFVCGRIELVADSLRFREQGESGIVLRVSDSSAQMSADHRLANHEVTLGMRPEALQPIGPVTAGLSSTASENGSPERLREFIARVLVVEPLGDRMDLHMETPAGTDLIARVPAQHQIQPGTDWRFRVEPDSTHLFDADGHVISQS